MHEENGGEKNAGTNVRRTAQARDKAALGMPLC
jgi:hypothetical protein